MAGTRTTAAAKPAKRADAQRNIAAIVDATVQCLGRDPDASMSDIAAAAGVGRVTIYGHFPSRADLVDAAFVHAIDQGEAALATLDLTDDPRQALARLIASSWHLVEQSRSLLQAAQATLPPGRIRALHTRPAERVQNLLTRGQQDGVFRSDLPVSWLVSVLHSVLHGAADEINAGRLSAGDAAASITTTVLAAFTAPGVPVPAG
ncbi:MAG: TetR/AcrR family transcriptional regulator [Thermocrispum sp.]